MEILEIIAHKLNKFGIAQDEIDMQITLNEVDQSIKNYCNIDNIPNELLYVRANLVVDYIRYQDANKPDAGIGVDVSATQKVGPLTSITSGGVSYGFANNAANKNHISNAHTADLDDVLHNYKHQLNQFRRLTYGD